MVASEGIAVPENTSYVSWTPVVLGALVAAAFSSILLAFGATIGLAVTSTAPTWRDASAALLAELRGGSPGQDLAGSEPQRSATIGG